MPAKVLFIVDKVVWFICTARNAIVVIICLLLSWSLDPELHDCKKYPDECVFSLTGSIQGGLPAFQRPPFSILANSTRNGTYPSDDIAFGDMVSKLGSAIIIIPIIAILESVAIAKAFGKVYCSGHFLYHFNFSGWQTCRCKPGNDCSWYLQHFWFFCPIDADHRLLLQDSSEFCKRSQDIIRWNLHWWFSDFMPCLSDALLCFHSKGNTCCCDYDRSYIQC